LSYSTIKVNASNKITHRLLDIVESKQTNLCVSADVNTKKELLALADQVGPYICALKTHIDTVSDIDADLIVQLKNLSVKHRFLLFEDRKFADIGHIAMQQFTSAPLSIADWADMVTVHVVAGSSSIDALRSTGKLENTGLVIVAQMSTADTLTSREYTKQALAIAQKHQDVVVGIVGQDKRPRDAGLMMFTPGISLSDSGDAHGQVYNTPQEAFEERGIDVMIVGRGIYKSDNPAAKAAEYRQIGWKSYLKRLGV